MVLVGLLVAACGTPSPTTPRVAEDIPFVFGRLGKSEDWHLPDVASIEVRDVAQFRNLLRNPAPKSIEIWDVNDNPKQQAVVCAELAPSDIAVKRLAVFVPFTSRPMNQVIDCLARLPIEYLVLQSTASLDLAYLLTKLPRLRGLELETYELQPALLPTTTLEELRFVNMTAGPDSARFLEAVAAQPGLRTLHLHSTHQPWTLEQLQPIARMMQLTSLRLDVDAPGDALAAVISSLPGLQAIDLGYSADDRVAEALSREPKLETLRITHNKMTDAGFASLAQLSQLRHLEMVATTFSDDAMTALQAFRQLRSLYVAGYSLSMTAVRMLMASRNLHTLGLGNGIGDGHSRDLSSTVFTARCGNRELQVGFCMDPNAGLPCGGTLEARSCAQ